MSGGPRRDLNVLPLGPIRPAVDAAPSSARQAQAKMIRGGLAGAGAIADIGQVALNEAFSWQSKREFPVFTANSV